MKTYSRITSWSQSRGITAQKPYVDEDWEGLQYDLEAVHNAYKEKGVSGYVLNKLEELAEYCEAQKDNDMNGIVDAIADSRIYDGTELCKMGYNIEKVDNECLLIVESRTGQWDDELGKFAKDESPEAQAKWYEPDYVNNCKEPECKTPSLFGFEKKGK